MVHHWKIILSCMSREDGNLWMFHCVRAQFLLNEDGLRRVIFCSGGFASTSLIQPKAPFLIVVRDCAPVGTIGIAMMFA